MTDFFYKIHSRLGIRPFPFRLKFIRVLFETEKYFNYFLQDRTQLYITGFTLFFSWFLLSKSARCCCARGAVTLRSENPPAAETVRPAAPSRATAVLLPFLYDYASVFSSLVTFTNGSDRVHLFHKMSLFLILKLGLKICRISKFARVTEKGRARQGSSWSLVSTLWRPLAAAT